MKSTIQIQEFGMPHISTRDYNEFNRAFDAWLRRHGHVAEAEKRQRFAKCGQRKGTK